MSQFQVFMSSLFPDRLQLELGTSFGPFSQDGPLGQFDPRRDLEIYVDGRRVPIVTAFFDQPNNRYLMFTDRSINTDGVVQVVHHIPNPPFFTQAQGWGLNWGVAWGLSSPGFPVGGFALLATPDEAGWGVAMGVTWGSGQ
jgi:hypothetical protein